MGRPSPYNPDIHPETARSLARKGKTNLQIAQAIGVSLDTIQVWINQYPEFSEALKEGKAPADAKVEKSLFQRAIGYKYTEKKVIQLPDGTIRKEVTEKEVAPDVTAQIFWLKNRLPDEWRDKSNLEHSGPGGTPIPISQVDVEKILGTKAYRDYEKKLFAEITAAKSPNARA
jgi:transposase-like protein